MVEQAVQYIETHFESIRTVREVAASIGVSYESLRKRFARSVGMPMQSFLAMVRVRKAQEWYRATDRKLYAVARDVGFTDDAALRRQWKRYLGQCPREARMHAASARQPERPYYHPDRPVHPRDGGSGPHNSAAREA
jgi:transcriptional regulator GlxA family with amidase domain